MQYGYARVSSTEQETTLQRDALTAAGIDRLVQEKRSAVAFRPALEGLLMTLQPGDAVVVYKVDRLARSLSDLLHILGRVDQAGATFRSLTEPIETQSAAGRLMLQMLGAFAEFERALIRERSIAGQMAARRRGAVIGRPRSLTEDQEREAYRMVRDGQKRTAVARHFGVHLSSIKRVVLRQVEPHSPAVRRRA
jgi:DNA invertase Pin-like site-specific DNA recombinase